MKRALGLAAAAVLAMALVAVPAGAKTKTKTYSSGTVNVPIPDAAAGPPFVPGIAAAAVPVKDKGTVKKLAVGVRITHADTADLSLVLFKGEKWANLALHDSGPGTNDDDFGAGTPDCAGQFTVFDDASSVPIFAGVNPFVGSFEPEAAAAEHSLKQYVGDQSKGSWNLIVIDDSALDTGTINCVTVTIKRKL